MMETYRCSMMPGMPAESIQNPLMTAQSVMPSCASCQGQSENTASISKSQLMRQIMEAGFAMDDAVLFLDTHPENRDAIRYYQSVRDMRNQAMSAYERQFGPLNNSRVTSSSWDWVTEKWPWEGGC